jgi:hypothetical protein
MGNQSHSGVLWVSVTSRRACTIHRSVTRAQVPSTHMSQCADLVSQHPAGFTTQKGLRGSLPVSSVHYMIYITSRLMGPTGQRNALPVPSDRPGHVGNWELSLNTFAVHTRQARTKW